jgi:hypothetical protein
VLAGPQCWLHPQNNFSKLVTPAVCHEAMGPCVPCAADELEKNEATALWTFSVVRSVVSLLARGSRANSPFFCCVDLNELRRIGIQTSFEFHRRQHIDRFQSGKEERICEHACPVMQTWKKDTTIVGCFVAYRLNTGSLWADSIVLGRLDLMLGQMHH